jgi:hypothetical protein
MRSFRCRETHILEHPLTLGNRLSNLIKLPNIGLALFSPHCSAV